MTIATEYTASELHQLKRKQLQSMCKKHGIKANGKSEELIEQLLNTKEEDGEEHISTAEDNDITRRVAEELNARANSLDAQERQEILNQQTPHKPPAAESILLDKPPKTPSFDRMHSKMFDMDQSIASHWSVTSPRGKRTNIVEQTESCKRPRIEALFGSPRMVKAPRTIAVSKEDRIKWGLDKKEGDKPAPLFFKKSAEPIVEGKKDAVKEQVTEKEAIIPKDVVKESVEPIVEQEAETQKDDAKEPAEPIVEGKSEVSKEIKKDVVMEPTKPIVEKEAVKAAKPIVGLKEAASKTSVKNKTSVVSGGKIQKKPLSTKSQNYRNVESKLKSYLNTKPPSPKVKAIKHSRLIATEHRPKIPAKPKQPVVKQPTDGVPNYMRSTKSKQLKTVAK